MRRVFIVSIFAPGCGADDVAVLETEGSSTAEATGSSSASTTSASASSDPTSSTSTGDTVSTSGGSGESSSTGPSDVCGDGTLAGDEECDDGNSEDGDACTSTCEAPFTIAWTQTFDGADHLRERAQDVVIASDGSIYVVGTTFSLAQRNDLWLRQYAADGTEGWTFTFDDALSGDDYGIGIAMHASGDLIVVGSTDSENGQDVLVLRMASSDSSVVWQRTYDGPYPDVAGDAGDAGYDVAVDPGGDLLVAGQERGAETSYDVWLARYDSDGGELWHVTHATDGSDQADGVTIDDLGLTWIAGTTDLLGAPNGWLGGYDADGTLVDEQSFPTAEVYSVHHASDGRLLVCGLRPYGTSFDAFTIALDESLATIWESLYNGPARGEDGTLGLATSADGDIYVAGYETVAHAGLDVDLFVARLSPKDGERIWADRYDSGIDMDDHGQSIAIGPDGSIVVAGAASATGQTTDMFVRKYVER